MDEPGHCTFCSNPAGRHSCNGLLLTAYVYDAPVPAWTSIPGSKALERRSRFMCSSVRCVVLCWAVLGCAGADAGADAAAWLACRRRLFGGRIVSLVAPGAAPVSLHLAPSETRDGGKTLLGLFPFVHAHGPGVPTGTALLVYWGLPCPDGAPAVREHHRRKVRELPLAASSAQAEGRVAVYDPTHVGGVAVMANHACREPTMIPKYGLSPDGAPQMSLVAAVELAHGTELTWSYDARCDDRSEIIYCGCPECRRLPTRKRAMVCSFSSPRLSGGMESKRS